MVLLLVGRLDLADWPKFGGQPFLEKFDWSLYKEAILGHFGSLVPAIFQLV